MGKGKQERREVRGSKESEDGRKRGGRKGERRSERQGREEGVIGRE